MAKSGDAPRGSWSAELDDLLRALTGGFLVGIPLLYTMETWRIGATITPPRAVLLLAIAYLLNLLFVTWVGFRRQEPGGLERFEDALEATAVAVVASAVTLLLLNRLGVGQSAGTIVGRVAVNAVPISLGVAIANHILDSGNDRAESHGRDTSSPADDNQSGPRTTLLDLGAAFAGAFFLSFNIAPTREIPRLATTVPVLYLPLIALFSLMLSYGIVFVAGFGGEEARLQSTGPFQHPITETVIAYLVSLVTSAAMLWLFGAIGPGSDTSWHLAYGEIVLLGLPAAIGAAAGRLAV